MRSKAGQVEKPEQQLKTLGLWLVAVLAAILLLIPVAFATLKFGRRFLVQFFLSPFQMFIVLPFGLTLFCLWKGYMPLKRGGKVERAANPAFFWTSVAFYALVGMSFFLLNLWISWQVLSRPR